MHAPRQQAQPSPDSGGQGRRVRVFGESDHGIHGGLVEALLVAADAEDEVVLQLLRSLVRDDLRRVAELAAVIAAGRGNSQGPCVSLPPRPVAYENKLLAAIHREEILLDLIAAASARREQPKLFSLCRKLCENRKGFDPEFRRELRMPSQPEPFDCS